MPVLVGAANPQGLVNTVAVTVSPIAKALFLIFNTTPTSVASAGMTIVFVIKLAVEAAPKPTQPPLLMGVSVAKYIVELAKPTAPLGPVAPVGPLGPLGPVGPVAPDNP